MASYGKGADLEGTALEWLQDVRTLENQGIKRTGAILAVSANEMLGRLEGSYKRLIDSSGGEYRYTAQQQAARVNAIAEKAGDFINPATRRQIIELQKQDLIKAQQMGNQAGIDLDKIIKERSKTLQQNARPNMPAIDAAGKRLNDFWSKENTSFRDRVRALTQVGAAQGLSYRKLANQVRELLVLEKQQGTESRRSQRINQKLGVQARAELIARTEIQTAYVQGQIDQARRNQYAWGRWSAGGERTCGFCISRHGMIYELDDIEGQIPAHPRCRCTVIPVEAPDGWKKGDKVDPKTADLDDEFWTKARADQIKEWKRDQNTNRRGERKPAERLKSNSELDQAIRRYLNTPTNTQQYLFPGSDAVPPLWKPSGNTIPDPAAAAQIAADAAAAQAAKPAADPTADKPAETKPTPEPDQPEVAPKAAKQSADELARLNDELKRKTKEFDAESKKLQTAKSQAETNRKFKAEEQAKIDALKAQRIADAESLKVDTKRSAGARKAVKDAQESFDNLNKRWEAKKNAVLEATASADALEKKLKSGGKKAGDSDAAYSKAIAAKSHNLETIKRLGDDVLKRAGVTRDDLIQDAPSKAKLQKQLEGAQQTDGLLRNNLKEFAREAEFLQKAVYEAKKTGKPQKDQKGNERSLEYLEQALKYAERDLAGWRDRVNNNLVEINKLKKQIETAGSSDLAADAAQKVIDELVRTSPLSRQQATDLVKAISTETAWKQNGQSKSKHGLPEVADLIDAVQMYGGLQNVAAYGVKSARAHAVMPQYSGDRFALGQIYGAGYINAGTGMSGPVRYRQTQFHELGHFVEFSQADIFLAAKQFIGSRAVGSSPKGLNSFYPGAGYGAHEKAWAVKKGAQMPISYYVMKDYTPDPLVGRQNLSVPDRAARDRAFKDYDLKAGKIDPRQARWGDSTEVIAMGVEHLADAPALTKLARMDFEHLQVALGTVRLTQARNSNGTKQFTGEDWHDTSKAKLDDIPDAKDSGKKLSKADLDKLQGEIKEFRRQAGRAEQQLRRIEADAEAAEARLDAANKAAKDLPSQANLNNRKFKLDDLDRKIAKDTEALKGYDDAYDALVKGVSSQGAKVEGLRKGITDLQRQIAAAEGSAAEDMLGRSYKAKVSDVKADPERFQYKVNANKATGEVGSLKGVQRWNEDMAGVISVWKDPANGQTYVINGHNRLALAKRLGVKDIPVLEIKAANAAEARMIGAKQNIASGDGTAIDAAKFMRDSGLKAADLQRVGMNLKAKVARDGAALANLPDHVFRAAVEGRLPIDKAAALGRSGLEPAQMADAYKVLKKRPTMPTAQIDELLAAARASTTRTKREQTLFGTDEVATTTMVERAKLAANVKADLKKQVGVLEKAAKNAEALKAKGNRIDVQKAEVKAANARAQLEVFDLQKNRPGSRLNTVLNDAATALQDATGRGGKAKASKAGKDSVLDALAADIQAMQQQPGGLLRAVADLQAKQQGRKAKPPELELEQGRPDLTAGDIPPRFIDPAKAKAGTMGSLRPDQIQVDADRFQYKATTEKSGEVGSLEGVQRFDPNLAGVISVWKDPANGQTYVINGHNRLAAAKRLGADAVEVRYIKARSAEEARGIGAMANIAEGHGSAVDAAKWIRSTGLGGDGVRAMGLAMKKDVAVQGVALANLPDDLWRSVVNETISVDKAAAIGGGGLDGQGMAKVAKVLKHRPNASVETVRELVAAEKASMEMGTTGSLFGDDSAAYQMERAQLARDMRRDILSDKQLFSVLASNRAKAELESAGSTLDVDANARAAAEQDTVLSVYDQLKNSSGPVAEALSRGARAMEQAKSASERLRIKKQTREEITLAVEQELGGAMPGQTELPPEAPGQESLF